MFVCIINTLNGTEQFSHIWVVWVFHKNTNVDAAAKTNNQKNKTVPAKIQPPRLHGARVGCLSTRSPHRPNPIGLSVAEVRRVSVMDERCVTCVILLPRPVNALLRSVSYCCGQCDCVNDYTILFIFLWYVIVLFRCVLCRL